MSSSRYAQTETPSVPGRGSFSEWDTRKVERIGLRLYSRAWKYFRNEREMLIVSNDQ